MSGEEISIAPSASLTNNLDNAHSYTVGTDRRPGSIKPSPHTLLANLASDVRQREEESYNDNGEAAFSASDPDAMEIDCLEESFTRILNNDIISVVAPTSLHVPKDYSMQYDNLLGSHDVQVKLYEKCLKERQLRSSTQASKRRQISPKPGFDPAEIVRKRALDFGDRGPSEKSSTLSCDIHPFFRVENFHGCPDLIYEEMKPGLRLATLLLTQKVCSTYWHTLWFGERQICNLTSHKLQKTCFRIRKDISWSSTNHHIFSQVLAQHADRVHFYFHSRSTQPTPCFASMAWVTDIKTPFHTAGSGSFAATTPQMQSTRILTNGDQDTFLRGKIHLHTDFYTVAKRLSRLVHPDPAAVLRYNFWLATCLCHEAAHYFEWVRRSMIPAHGHEAFWYDDAWNEAGEAWEKKTWNGRVEPVASRADCMYGIATIEWPLKRWDLDSGKEIKETVVASSADTENNNQVNGAKKSTGVPRQQQQHNVYWTVPMEFICRVQQQATWDSLATDDFVNDKAFHIPRSISTATKSVELLSLDMTIWDDESVSGLISDDIDDEDTLLKRTFDGRIVKTRKRSDVVMKQSITKMNSRSDKFVARVHIKKAKKEANQDGPNSHPPGNMTFNPRKLQHDKKSEQLAAARDDHSSRKHHILHRPQKGKQSQEGSVRLAETAKMAVLDAHGKIRE